MKALSYITAAILVISWAIGYLLFGMDRGIHVLIVLAFATAIQQVVQIRRFSYHFFRSSHSKTRPTTRGTGNGVRMVGAN